MAMVIALFLTLLASNPVNAGYLTDNTKSNVSRHLDAFFIHVEETYLDDKKLEELPQEDRISLLGYALGRQAPNVNEIQTRKETFEKLEDDLHKYCAVLAEFRHPGVVSIFTRDKYTTELWRKAQASMMGFYEDELIRTYGFDQWGIPNIFESLETGDEEPYDPKSLVGKWRSESTNDVFRYVPEGNFIKGYIADVGTSYTLSVGELFGVFRKTGSNVYEGKLKMKTSAGQESWIEGFKITVEDDIAYVGHERARNPIRYFRIW